MLLEIRNTKRHNLLQIRVIFEKTSDKYILIKQKELKYIKRSRT